MNMFKEIADIKTSDQLKLPVPEAEYETVVLKPTDQQKEIVESFGERAEVVRNGGVDASVDNMLRITNDGRKLALDQRLVNDTFCICIMNKSNLFFRYTFLHQFLLQVIINIETAIAFRCAQITENQLC